VNRILFVTESLFPLGPAGQLDVLARQLAERSWEVHLAVLHEGATDVQTGAADAHTLAGSNVEIHSLGTTVFSQPFSRASLRSIHRLRKLIQRLEPDFIQGWCGTSGFVTLAATDSAFLGSKRTVRRLNTELFLQPEKRFTRQLYEKRLSPGFETVVVPHESAKIHLIENGYDEDDIEIIDNMLCPLEVARDAGRELILAKLNLPAEAKIAGTVAPLIPRTRIKDLIYACDLLTVIRDDFHFLVFGKGFQEPRLRRFAKLTESNRHIHFLGEPHDAGSMLAGLDFYWHSHLMEPLPVNLLAAMANGIPAISVYGPGTSEIIKHQETGFAVNFGARDEFARWTKYLIELPDQAAKLSSQGQAFVQQSFTDRDYADHYLRLYV
jgi:glycosyltransferase involved in cell wall biosynthesis